MGIEKLLVKTLFGFSSQEDSRAALIRDVGHNNEVWLGWELKPMS